MALTKNTIIGLAIGGLALGVTAVVFLPKILKKSNGTTGGGSGSSDNGGGSGGNTSTSSSGGVAGAINTAMNVFNQGSSVVDTASQYLKKYNVGYVSERLADKQIIVHFAAPRPPKDSVKTGSKIKLSNMDKYSGIYTVKGTWTDGAGNQGAIYLDSDKVTSDNNDNRTWENKGEILTY